MFGGFVDNNTDKMHTQNQSSTIRFIEGMDICILSVYFWVNITDETK